MTDTFTAIECGQCGGRFVRSGDHYAECELCGHTVDVALDIVPNLDSGESIAWQGDTLGYTVA